MFTVDYRSMSFNEKNSVLYLYGDINEIVSDMFVIDVVIKR